MSLSHTHTLTRAHSCALIYRHTDIQHLPNTADPAIQRLTSLLDRLDRWIDDYPPLDDPTQRFGSKDYRKWCQRLVEVGSLGSGWGRGEVLVILLIIITSSHSRTR